MTIRINLSSHLMTNEQIIEVFDDQQLLATVIPRLHTIVIVSKFAGDVNVDHEYPPKITINLNREK